MISSSSMSRRWFWILFFGIVLFAATHRLWMLGSIPVSLYWDEAAMYVDVKSVLATGMDMHGRPWTQLIFPSYGDYKLPVYIWAAIGTSKLFGLSEFSLRLPSAIAGIITIIVAGGLSRVLLELSAPHKYTNQTLQKIQLSVMMIVTLSPWSILFSRTAFEGHLGQSLLGVSVLLAAWGLLRKNSWAFFLSPVIGALATYSYYSVRFVWIVVFAGVCLLYIINKYVDQPTLVKYFHNIKGLILRSLIAVVMFFICMLPMLNSPLAKDADTFRLGTDSVLNNDELALQSNVYREIAGNTTIDRVFYNKWWLLARELLKNYSDNTSPTYMFVSGDPNLRHGTTQFGLFYLIFLPVFMIGAAVLLKRHPFLGGFLFIWWIAALLPASVPENTPHALRSLNALIPLSIVIGFGTYWIWEKVSNCVLRTFLLCLVILSFTHFWIFYLKIYPKLSAQHWQAGYKPLALQISKETSQQHQVYIEPFDDRFYLWIMAYGPYDGSEFKSWKTDNYKFASAGVPNNFSNVFFTAPEDKQLLNELENNKQLVLVGRSQEVRKRCETATLYSCQLTNVQDENGETTFLTATLVKK